MNAPASTVSSMFDAAIWWSRMGFAVFPVFEIANGSCACGNASCSAPGKHPRTARWQILATTEDRQIREWWGRWPSANIGICCGRELDSGGYLLVVDVDPRHDGDMSLGQLEGRHGALPETPRSVTGGGGQHYYFRAPNPVKSRANALGPGVDVKCLSGYVLAPPSTHASGARYVRDVGADVAETPIADAPAWLLALASPPEPAAPAPARDADAYIEGGRHDAMLSLCGSMRRRGLSPAEMLPTMLAVNVARCKPPLDEDEIKRIAYSARWEAGDPLGGQDPWNLMSAAQIFAALPPYPWLVQGLHIAPGRITLLNGDADVGKTVVAQSLALAVASGQPVWGIYGVQRKGKVLHLNGEIGTYIARERYQRLARGHGIDPAAIADTLVLSNYPAARLDDADFEARLLQVVEGCQLVIVDSLRAFSGGLSEKDKEIGVALLMLARVSDKTGATIIVLHHNRKPSKDDSGRQRDAISGTTAILGGSECAYIMFKDDKNGPIRVSHERSPIGVKMDDFGLAIEDVSNGSDRRWGLWVRHLEAEQLAELVERAAEAKARGEGERASAAILEALRAHAGVYRGSKEGLRKTCRVGQEPFTRALDEMIADGRVRKGGTYHHPEWYLQDV